MAQRRSLAWTELRVGILVIVSFALLTMFIFYIGGKSIRKLICFSCTYRVTAYFPDANGLRGGGEVWLEGVTVGKVDDVKISPSQDPNRSVEVLLILDKDFQDKITTGCPPEEQETALPENAPCTVALISTIGVLGDKNVELTRGTPGNGHPIPDGGYIQGRSAGDIKQIIESSNDLVNNLDVLSQRVLEISADIKGGKGTLGKLMNDTSIYDNLNRTTLEMEALVKDARHGNGTIGRLLSDDTLYQNLKSTVDRTNSTIDQVNDTIAQVRNGKGTIAKFLNDPAIYDQMNEVIARFKTIVEQIDRGEGTAGKFIKDDKLYNDLRQVTARMDALIAEVQNGQGAAGKFIKDPALYNNLNDASSEVQKLLYDIRQNPKKFLTITLRLF
jgi:phospholipid/cholesterol/gamma-HCH transport system substrate-binding protein